MNPITIVSLGSGHMEDLTLRTANALKSAGQLVLRTQRHPVADDLKRNGVSFQALDALYETCEDFDELADRACKTLLAMAEKAAVVYAVADADGDETVAALLAVCPDGQKPVVLPGVTHAQRCRALLCCRQEAGPWREMTAVAFAAARVVPSESLLLTELHSRECAGDCKLKLMTLLPAELEVFFFEGGEDGALAFRPIPLCDLDRQPSYDHLAASYIPAVPMERRERYDIEDLEAIMRRLRAPGGCPWDREQTHESLLPHLLEEAYEFISATREQDVDHMYDELGDVLLQVVFHAEIARQHGEFDLCDVTTAISEKMIERHTHIFGNAKADTAEDVLTNWEAIKRRQRGIHTHAEAMKEVSNGLSSLLRAFKVQGKAAKVGFDFQNAADALTKVPEEAAEVLAELPERPKLPEELGDLLFSVVNVCRLCKVDPDIALFEATNKFISRFERMENAIKKAGKRFEDLTLAEMDVYWNTEKREL